ncbi:MAG: molybdate ABC transporter substrate-binding protein [Microbacteriaceae bacterium]
MSRAVARSAALAAAIGVLALAGCSGQASDGQATGQDTGTAAAEQTLTVYAAASLTATFTEIADDFEADHPGVTVQLQFAGSADLVTQITEGAPADVFASADEANMAKLTDVGLAADPVDFATNVLEIAVPPGNPAGVGSLQDLADDSVTTVICAPEVPCGAATVMVEEAAGITIPAVSEESSVTDVLGKVTSGEADAGLVYVTDVAGAGDDVEGVEFDESASAVNTYPIAVLSDSGQAELAAEFVAAVTGSAGQAVLVAAGFGTP